MSAATRAEVRHLRAFHLDLSNVLDWSNPDDSELGKLVEQARQRVASVFTYGDLLSRDIAALHERAFDIPAALAAYSTPAATAAEAMTELDDDGEAETRQTISVLKAALGDDDAMPPHVWPDLNGSKLGALDVPGNVGRDITLVLAQPADDPSAEWAVVGSTNAGMLACMIAGDYQRDEAKAGRMMSTRIVMGAVGPDIFDGVTTPFQAKKDAEEMGDVWP